LQIARQAAVPPPPVGNVRSTPKLKLQLLGASACAPARCTLHAEPPFCPAIYLPWLRLRLGLSLPLPFPLPCLLLRRFGYAPWSEPLPLLCVSLHLHVPAVPHQASPSFLPLFRLLAFCLLPCACYCPLLARQSPPCAADPLGPALPCRPPPPSPEAPLDAPAWRNRAARAPVVRRWCGQRSSRACR
jgi:hypothetical protein